MEDDSPVTVSESVYGNATVVVLSDEQFVQIQDGMTWITAGLFAILGAILILGFWSGWRSSK